jgi:hypothetical protein
MGKCFFSNREKEPCYGEYKNRLGLITCKGHDCCGCYLIDKKLVWVVAYKLEKVLKE